MDIKIAFFPPKCKFSQSSQSYEPDETFKMRASCNFNAIQIHIQEKSFSRHFQKIWVWYEPEVSLCEIILWDLKPVHVESDPGGCSGWGQIIWEMIKYGLGAL